VAAAAEGAFLKAWKRDLPARELHPVGRVTAERGLWLTEAQDEWYRPPQGGYDHFERS
jgi:hypothetical protein